MQHSLALSVWLCVHLLTVTELMPLQRPPLMYGAGSPIEKRPEDIEADSWHVMNIYHPAQAVRPQPRLLVTTSLSVLSSTCQNRCARCTVARNPLQMHHRGMFQLVLLAMPPSVHTMCS